MFLRGRCAANDVVPYMVAQVLGGLAAAAVATRSSGADRRRPAIHGRLSARALAAEFLYTFALAYVVLNVATAKATQGNSYFGLAIGFTVLVGAFAVGDLSGGAFNPAVAVGGTVMRLFLRGCSGFISVGELAGGVAAALLFKALNPGDK